MEEYILICRAWREKVSVEDNAETYGEAMRQLIAARELLDVRPPKELQMYHQGSVELTEAMQNTVEGLPPEDTLDPLMLFSTETLAVLVRTQEFSAGISDDTKAILWEHGC